MPVITFLMQLGAFISRLPFEHALMTIVQWLPYLAGHPLYGAPYYLLAVALTLGQIIWAIVFIHDVFGLGSILLPTPLTESGGHDWPMVAGLALMILLGMAAFVDGAAFTPFIVVAAFMVGVMVGDLRRPSVADLQRPSVADPAPAAAAA